MTLHRIAPEAIADLDSIVEFVASHGGTLQIAEKLVAAITRRFDLLTRYPYLGRARTDLGLDRRSSLVGDYLVVYRVDDRGSVNILRVVHGRRDITNLFE